MLACIKYKRLQQLLWQRKVLGDDPIDNRSVVMQGLDHDKRILSLKAQVEHLLNLAYGVHQSYFRRDQYFLCWKSKFTFEDFNQKVV